jgi:hypothetical protein
MPATPERAAFVAQGFRSAVWSNSTIRDMYGKVARDTGDQPIETYFDDMSAVQAMVNERGALLGGHARAFKVRIGALLDLEGDLDMATVLPAAHLTADELVADLACAVAAVDSYDTGNGQTTLTLWGTV